MMYLEFVKEINSCCFANAYYNIMLTPMIFNAYSDFVVMADSKFSNYDSIRKHNDNISDDY